MIQSRKVKLYVYTRDQTRALTALRFFYSWHDKVNRRGYSVEAHIEADASPYTTNAAHSLTVHPSRRIEIIAT